MTTQIILYGTCSVRSCKTIYEVKNSFRFERWHTLLQCIEFSKNVLVHEGYLNFFPYVYWYVIMTEKGVTKWSYFRITKILGAIQSVLSFVVSKNNTLWMSFFCMNISCWVHQLRSRKTWNVVEFILFWDVWECTIIEI